MIECYDMDCPWHEYQKKGFESEPFCTIDFCAKDFTVDSKKQKEITDEDAVKLLRIIHDFFNDLNEANRKAEEEKSKSYRIGCLQDLTDIPIDRLDDFFIDLKAALVAYQEMKSTGIGWNGMIWHDDGEYGEMRGIDLTVKVKNDE